MKIFTGTQIKELDKFTIENEPVASIDLMERAAKAIVRVLREEWDNRTPFVAQETTAAMRWLWLV